MQVSRVIKKYGYTIEEVAHKIGMKSGTSLRVMLSRKGGKDAAPTLTTLRKIAEALGCSVGEFFDDERVNVFQYSGVQPVLDIRFVLQAKGIRNKDLAERLGTSEQNLCALLGKDSATVARLYKIAEALDVPITALFRYEDENDESHSI